MKRNQMVQIIQDFIMDETPESISIEDSSRLLEHLEKSGMLPPTITVLPDHYNRDNGSYGFESNEWEEECSKSDT